MKQLVNPTAAVLVAVAFVASAAAAPAAEEPAATIALHKLRTTFFSGEEITLHVDVAADRAITGRLAWRHTADRRTLARGESAVAIRPGKPIEVGIALRLPEVRGGVIFETQLDFHLADAKGAVAAEQTHLLRIFPVDPLADRRQWLDGLDIVLFDPPGHTDRQFEEAGIPYKLVRSMAAVAAQSDGLLIVGEGTSLADHRGLGDALVKRAAAGMNVLCLAPADGELPFPGSGDEAGPPASLVLRRSDRIREFDNRLDAAAWAPGGRLTTTGFEPAQRRSGIVLAVRRSPDAWPWLEAAYPGGGRLVACGFTIIGRWDVGPSPRYLMTSLLEHVAPVATLDRTPNEEKQ